MVIVKVGLSRKLTRDFNSQGFNLDIQSELPSQAVDDPQAMAQATDYLFRLASDLLDAELVKAEGGQGSTASFGGAQNSESSNGVPKPENTGRSIPFRHVRTYPGTQGTADRNGQPNGRGDGNTNARRDGNGQTGGRRNGHQNGNGRGEGTPRPITEAQLKAIQKMAVKFETSGDAIAQEDFNCKLNELTIRQASELIDRLKKSLEAQEAGR